MYKYLKKKFIYSYIPNKNKREKYQHMGSIKFCWQIYKPNKLKISEYNIEIYAYKWNIKC